ncbi:MAG: SGNH/GDSL hydrolase family protein [Gammaproteobacteria bacterium]
MSSRFFSNCSRYTLLIIAIILSPSVWADKAYSNIFIFGDSLSDTGNIASIQGDLPTPPFFNNRVSNGLVAIDYVAASLNLNATASGYLIGPAVGGNYAVAGARAAGVRAIDLPAQIGAFMANHNGIAPVDALYVVFIGGNDVFDASKISDVAMANLSIDNGVISEGQQIQALINAGAEYLFVVNVVDISVTPLTTLAAAATQNPMLVKHTKKLTNRYNKKLKKTLKALNHANKIELVRFDLHEAFKNLLNDAKDAGFTNTTDACFSSITLSFNEGCNFGANFDQYIFFDEIHPSARTHKIIGNLMAGEVE